MKDEQTKYSYLELQHRLKDFMEIEKALQQSLNDIKIKIQGIKYAIKNNDEKNQEWMVNIPVNLIIQDFKNTPSIKWNWKKIVMTMFAKYNQPMTTETLYFKYLISFENPARDRLYVMRNISAAAHYLVTDDKLVKIKIDKNKGFLYCTYDQIDDSGKLKEEFRTLFIQHQ